MSQAWALARRYVSILANKGSGVGVIATRTGGPGPAAAPANAGGSPWTMANAPWPPATVPSVHIVAARPALSARVRMGEREPPGSCVVQLTTAPTSGFPSARSTWTTTGTGRVWATVSHCPEPEITRSRCCRGRRAWAVNVTASPQHPATTVWGGPRENPSCQNTSANPVLSVTVGQARARRVPPPGVTVQSTFTPGTPRPAASSACTVRGTGNS